MGRCTSTGPSCAFASSNGSDAEDVAPPPPEQPSLKAPKLCPTVLTMPYEFERYKELSLKFCTVLMSYVDETKLRQSQSTKRSSMS